MKNWILFICLLSTSLFAQHEAPTLSIGLDQILFKKGFIDVELVTEMIAEKQEELKKDFVQFQVKSKFKDQSYCINNFVHHTMALLMDEKDKNVMKKKLMEVTTSFALAYTLAELYLELSWDTLTKTENSYFTSIIPSWTAKKKDYEDGSFRFVNWNSVSGFNAKDFPGYKLSLSNSLELFNTADSSQYSFNNVLLDMVFHAIRNNDVFIRKGMSDLPLYTSITEYRKKSNYQNFPGGTFRDRMYMDVKHFIEDITTYYENFDVLANIIKSAKLKGGDIDISRIKGDLESKVAKIYASTNSKRDNLIKDEIEKLKIDLIGVEAHFQKLKADSTAYSKEVKTNTYKRKSDDEKRELEETFTENNANLAEQRLWVNQLKTKIKDLTIEVNHQQKAAAVKNLETDSIKVILASFRDQLNNKMRDLNDQSKSYAEPENKEGRADIRSQRGDPYSKFIQSTTYDSLYSVFISNYYYMYNKNFENLSKYEIEHVLQESLKILQLLNLKSQGKFQEVSASLQVIGDLNYIQLYLPFLQELKGKKLSKQFDVLIRKKFEALDNYIEFFARIDELDKVETYYYLLRNLSMAGDHIPNELLKSTFNTLTSAIDRYTVLHVQEEQIDIQVEDIIEALLTKYDSKKKLINFHFTVGLNQSYALSEGSKISFENKKYANFNYVSEKIGLRFNLYDHDRYYEKKIQRELSENKYSLLQSIDVLTYGSGLLYQVTSLSTIKGLNVSFIGMGLNFKSYNNLGINISYQWTVYPNQDLRFESGMLNLAFEIYFSEYLKAVNKKRKMNKRSEDL